MKNEDNGDEGGSRRRRRLDRPPLGFLFFLSFVPFLHDRHPPVRHHLEVHHFAIRVDGKVLP